MTTKRSLLICLTVWATGCLPIGRGEKVDLPSETYPVSQGVSVDDSLSVELDAAVQNYLNNARVTGLSVGVYGPGEVLYTAGYGWAELETEREMTSRTPILLSSVSKTFIGVAAMQAVEAGRLELDTPMSKLSTFEVNNPRVDGDAIQLIDLLTHTSGLEDSLVYGANYSAGDPVIPLGEFVEGYVVKGGSHYRRANWSKRKPGEAYAYSNVGAAWAAHAIAASDGMEFSDLVRRDILEPLGMHDSAYFLSEQTLEPALPYGRAGEMFRSWEHYGYPTYPDGMMRSGADDLARFGAAVLGGGMLDGVRILEESSVERMTRVDPSIDAYGEEQAVIWVDTKIKGRTVTGHNGGDLGSFTELNFDAEAGAGVLLLFNTVPDSYEDYKAVLRLEDELIGIAADWRKP